MVIIGIIGDFSKISLLISKIYKTKSLKVEIAKNINKIETNPDILIINLTNINIFSKIKLNYKINILIINNAKNNFKYNFMSINLEKNSIILLNSDQKNKINIIDFIPHYIITYGFNKKSTVTLSSIKTDIYQTIQLCLQRSIPTLSGKYVYEQEFSINCQLGNINSILAAFTAAIVNDIDIKNINLNIF